MSWQSHSLAPLTIREHVYNSMRNELPAPIAEARFPKGDRGNQFWLSETEWRLARDETAWLGTPGMTAKEAGFERDHWTFYCNFVHYASMKGIDVSAWFTRVLGAFDAASVHMDSRASAPAGEMRF